jgi:hypothetical protein
LVFLDEILQVSCKLAGALAALQHRIAEAMAVDESA